MSNNEKLYLQYGFPEPDGKQHCGVDGAIARGGLECDSPGIYVMMHPTNIPDEYTLTTDNGNNNLPCGMSPNYGDLVCNKGQTPDTFKLSNNCLQMKTQTGDYINCKPDSIYDGGMISCSSDYKICDNKFDMNRVSQGCSCWESTTDGLNICSDAKKVKNKCVSEYSPAQVDKNWDLPNTSPNSACHSSCKTAFGSKAGWQGVWHNVAGSANAHSGSSCEDKGWSAGCDCTSQQCHWKQ